MKQLILSQTDWIVMPQVTVILFVSIFSLAVFLVMRPGAKAYYKQHERLVFDDEPQNGDEG